MTKEIKLFFSDIDGCLCQPYAPYDLDGFRRLGEWAARAEEESGLPRIGHCSGRSYAYVEAIAQAIDLRAPALFESGGGFFFLPSAHIEWNPAVTPRLESELSVVRTFFLEEVVARGNGFSLDYGKRSQASVVNVDHAEVVRFLPTVRDFVTGRFPELQVYETHASIDVVPLALTKLEALKWAAKKEGVGVDELAFIGDARGDVQAIEAVGAGFAPQNGTRTAKRAADVVTENPSISGVLEAYQWCVDYNCLVLEAA